MTSYIPSLTLPSAVFANPAASILLPIALGTTIGFTMSRMSLLFQFCPLSTLLNHSLTRSQ